MNMKYFVAGYLAIAAAALGAGSAAAQDTIKIGMVMQITGPNAPAAGKSPPRPSSIWRSMATASPARRSS